MDGRKTIALQGVTVKLVKWQPTTRDDEQALLRGLGIAEGSIQSKSFDACSIELASAMHNAQKILRDIGLNES